MSGDVALYAMASFVAGFVVGAVVVDMLLKKLSKEFRDAIEKMRILNNGLERLENVPGMTKNIENSLMKMMFYVEDLRKDVVELNNILRSRFKWVVNVELKNRGRDDD